MLPYCSAEIEGSTFANGEQLYVVYNETTIVAWLWCLYFIFSVPELLSFLRAVRVCIVRSVLRPHWMDFAVVFSLETLHVVGVCLMFFGAFPGMDTTMALMATNGVALLPAVLKMACGDQSVPPRKSWMKVLFRVLSVCAAIIQVAGLVVWPVVNLGWSGGHYFENGWALPVGMLFASCGNNDVW